MSLLKWSETLALGNAALDEIHEEFINLLGDLQDCSDHAFLPTLDTLVRHCEDHFSQEGIWMKESGFPPIHCHEEEHDKVLVIARDVRNRVAAGDVALGRTLARELNPWFEHHAATMDTVLVGWMRQQNYGARRDLAEKGARDRRGEPEGCCHDEAAQS